MIRTVNVGIDLGTTNTLCCLQDNQNKVSPIRFMRTGNDINLPSVIYYDGGNTIVGKRALEKLRQNPDNGYASSKTQIGSDARRVLNGKVFTPTDAAACILCEVKDTIQSQVRTVFFLPLITANIHLLVAFPMIMKIMEVMFISNTSILVGCMIGTVVVFAVIYYFVFRITSKSYIKIVGNHE